jgi:hypothetical protein
MNVDWDADYVVDFLSLSGQTHRQYFESWLLPCTFSSMNYFHSLSFIHGSVVVEALCYKLEGRGFETR